MHHQNSLIHASSSSPCCSPCEWMQAAQKLLSNIKTRDALYRVIQFSLRVILAVRGIAAANPHSASLFARLMASGTDKKLLSTVSALSTGRKVLAFGNIISEVPNTIRLARGLDMKNLTVDSVLPLLRSACMLNFWIYDHIAWLTAGAKVLDFCPKKVSVVQARFWFTAVLCSLTLDTKALVQHIQDVKGADSDEEKKKQLTERAKTLALHEARDVCDLIVATNNSAIIRMPPLLVGICGAFSAASIIYEALA